MTKPISPDDVVVKKKEILPKEVFEAFNELIIEGWNGYQSIVKQKEVVILIAQKLDIESTSIIYSNHYLDIEEIYEEAGWNVEYDKPGYCESYEATFTFTKKK